MKEKIQEIWYSKTFYWVIRILGILIFILPSFLGLVWCIKSLYLNCFENPGGTVDKLVLYVTSSIVAIFLCIVECLLVVPIITLLRYNLSKMTKIEKDMKALPKDSIVQYSVPKGISVSEIGFLMYQDVDISNFFGLLYQWENFGYVKIEIKHSVKSLVKMSDLGENVSEYELQVFQLLFENGDEVEFSNIKPILEENKRNLTLELMKVCVKKQWITTKKSKFLKNFYKLLDASIEIFVLMWIGLLKLITPAYLWLIVFVIAFLGGSAFLGYAIKRVKLWYDNGIGKFDGRKVELTKKGQEILKEILGYKYYLEKCEEREITENLSDKKLLRKVIPYAIVFKLNRKILDNLF